MRIKAACTGILAVLLFIVTNNALQAQTTCENFDDCIITSGAISQAAFTSSLACLSDWSITHGSPSVYASVDTPTPTASTLPGVTAHSGDYYALFGACNGGYNGSEGATFNFHFEAGKTYQITLWVNTRNLTPGNATNPIHAKYYLLENSIPYSPPPGGCDTIPDDSLFIDEAVLLEEDNYSNQTWQEVTLCVRPSATDYYHFWIHVTPTTNSTDFLLVDDLCVEELPQYITLSEDTIVSCDTGLVTLTITPSECMGPLTYSWYPSVGITQTGANTFTIDQTIAVSGTYTVTGYFAGGGYSVSTSFVNIVKNCCLQYTSRNYTAIDQAWVNAQLLLSPDVILPYKSFVTEEITIPSGAKLIINNCEVLFAYTYAGFVFEPFAQVDAQNSALKPCDPTSYWKGFKFIASQFDDFSSGVIHECVFTSAEKAVSLVYNDEGGDYLMMDIMNNEFFNCKYSVVVNQIEFTGPIAGNTFHKNANTPDYSGFDSWAELDIPIGLAISGSVLHRDITDNHFTCDATGDFHPYKGLVSYSSQFNAVNNDFTNMFRALDIIGDGDVIRFEANNIKYSALYEPSYSLTDQNTYAVRITNTNTGVLLFDNFFHYYADNVDLNKYAVYAENSSQVFVFTNTINGFSDVIQFIDVQEAYIFKNTISNFNRTGVLLQESSDIMVYLNNISTSYFFSDGLQMTGILSDESHNLKLIANTINMDGIERLEDIYPNASSSSVGIECLTDGDADDLTIQENCIFEVGVAISLVQSIGCGSPTPTNCNIPTITNNYMYNYCDAGIRFSGNYAGNIGTANTAAAGARNSFVSNYLPVGSFGNAYDVDNTGSGTIVMWGNSAILSTNGSVTVNDNSITSTTGCGNFVGNSETEGSGKTDEPTSLLMDYQKNYEVLYPVTLVDGDFILDADYVTQLSELASNDKVGYLIGLNSILERNSNYTTEATTLQQYINSGPYLSSNEKVIFNCQLAISHRDWTAVGSHIANLNPNTQDERDFASVVQVVLAIGNNQMDAYELPSSTQNELAAIDARRGKYAAIARDVLNLSTISHDYIFQQVDSRNYKYSSNTSADGSGKPALSIYPNPSNGNFTIKLAITEKLVDAELHIINIYGQRVYSQQVNAAFDELEISLPELSTGVFIIEVTNNGKRMDTQKLLLNK